MVAKIQIQRYLYLLCLFGCLFAANNGDPQITCPTNVTSDNYVGENFGIIFVSTDEGSPNATITWDPPVTSDNNNETVTVVSSPYESGDMIPYSSSFYTIHFTATDPYGNVSTCYFYIQIQDLEPPMPTCPYQVNGVTDMGNPNGTVMYNITVTDNVLVLIFDTNYTNIVPDFMPSVDQVSYEFETTGVFPIGETIVEYSFHDSATPTANTRTCYVTVIITVIGNLLIMVDSESGIYYTESYYEDFVDFNFTKLNLSEEHIYPVAIDFNPDTNYIYWSDTGKNSILRAQFKGDIVETVVTYTSLYVKGLTIDKINKKLYWTDYRGQTVMKSNLDGSEIITLVSQNISKPIGIALDIENWHMYWTDWDKHTIERANMDGEDRIILIDSEISWPNDIALDISENRMYWSDCFHGIQYSDLLGQNQGILLFDITCELFAVDIVGSYLYWTDVTFNRIDIFKMEDSYLAGNQLAKPAGFYFFKYGEGPDTITCPMDITVNITNGVPYAINVTWIEPSTIYNSRGIQSPVSDYTPGNNMFSVGATTVQYSVSDSSGNINDGCSFVVTVEDLTTALPISTDTTTIDPTTEDSTTVFSVSTDITMINPTTEDSTTLFSISTDITMIDPTTEDSTKVLPTDMTTVDPTTEDSTKVFPSLTDLTMINPTTEETPTVLPISTDITTIDPTTEESTTVLPVSTDITTIESITEDLEATGLLVINPTPLTVYLNTKTNVTYSINITNNGRQDIQSEDNWNFTILLSSTIDLTSEIAETLEFTTFLTSATRISAGQTVTVTGVESVISIASDSCLKYSHTCVIISHPGNYTDAFPNNNHYCLEFGEVSDGYSGIFVCKDLEATGLMVTNPTPLTVYLDTTNIVIYSINITNNGRQDIEQMTFGDNWNFRILLSNSSDPTSEFAETLEYTVRFLTKNTGITAGQTVTVTDVESEISIASDNPNCFKYSYTCVIISHYMDIIPNNNHYCLEFGDVSDGYSGLFVCEGSVTQISMVLLSFTCLISRFI